MTEKTARPLSPHLQVYRLPYNALMSIIGRAVGIGLSLGVTIVLMWFIGAVWNPEIYDMGMDVLSVPFIRYALFPIVFIIFFYLGNGVRHVLWDMSIGVNVKTGVTTGNIVLLLSAALTLGLWVASVQCCLNSLEDTATTELEGANNVE